MQAASGAGNNIIRTTLLVSFYKHTRNAAQAATAAAIKKGIEKKYQKCEWQDSQHIFYQSRVSYLKTSSF